MTKKKNSQKDNYPKGTIVIKKYPNRRLYRTDESRYITLDDITEIVRRNENFVVVDVKTNADLTRSVLTQIIFEQESKGGNMLPINFLRKIITFYGDNLSSILPSYLEASMESFSKNQEQMREYLQNRFSEFFPLKQFEDVRKQNLAIFESAMQMLSQFNPVTAALNQQQQKDKKDEK